MQARFREKHRNDVVLSKRAGLIYGHRGTDPDLLYLSPYELCRYLRIWAFGIKRKPSRSTPTVKVVDVTVIPIELTQSWVLMRKSRPDVPKLYGCPMPKSGRGAIEHTARIV